VVSVQIFDFESGSSFFVFPNPNKGTLTITAKDSFQVKEIRIFNLQGQIVYKNNHNFNKTSIIMDGPSGIYFLEIENEKGIIHQEKIVKL
jgi:hypothetical protein